jgi:K+ transporter
MKKNTGLKIVNPILMLVFITLATSGIFHEAISYEIFHNIHPVLGFTFIALAFLHLSLNYSWIKQNITRKK